MSYQERSIHDIKDQKNITKLNVFQKKYLNQLLDLNTDEYHVYDEADGD
jgi:cell division septum initiation protein DivIVA